MRYAKRYSSVLDNANNLQIPYIFNHFIVTIEGLALVCDINILYINIAVVGNNVYEGLYRSFDLTKWKWTNTK